MMGLVLSLAFAFGGFSRGWGIVFAVLGMVCAAARIAAQCNLRSEASARNQYFLLRPNELTPA